MGKNVIPSECVVNAGDEILVNGLKRVWVICPDCSNGRWVAKTNARQTRFTGRCRECYMVEARRAMGRYFCGGT